VNLVEELNLFNRRVTLSEKRKSVAKTIVSMKRKYVSLKSLQDEMGLEDHEMEEMVSDMKRKNRFSNQFIFTEVDGEAAVGVTAAKRKRKKQNLGDPLSDTEHNAGDDEVTYVGESTEEDLEEELLAEAYKSYKKKKRKQNLGEPLSDTEHNAGDDEVTYVGEEEEEEESGKTVSVGDLTLAKRRSHKKKMSKVKTLSNDITNKHESVDPNRLYVLKRNYQRAGWQALMKEANFPWDDYRQRSAEDVMMEMAVNEKITDQQLDKMIKVPPKQAAKELMDHLSNGGRLRVSYNNFLDWWNSLEKEYPNLNRHTAFQSWVQKVQSEMKKLGANF
jgi:hypothetical protein